jgi:hypothetical protein
MKEKMFKNNSKCTYVLLTQTRTVTNYMSDPEKAQQQTKRQLSWPQPKSGHESRWGSTPRWTNWLTDRQTERLLQSNFQSDSHPHRRGLPMTIKPILVWQHINVWSWAPQNGPTDRPSVAKWLGLETTKQNVSTVIQAPLLNGCMSQDFKINLFGSSLP